MENTTEDKELLLNQWQTCVDMANSVSQRRDNMNNIFITLNLAIMSAVSITMTISLKKPYFTELFYPNRYTCLEYAIFGSKAFEGLSLFKMKTYNLLFEFWFIVFTHL